eukprot:2770014-Rhodomonas_salina.1
MSIPLGNVNPRNGFNVLVKMASAVRNPLRVASFGSGTPPVLRLLYLILLTVLLAHSGAVTVLASNPWFQSLPATAQDDMTLPH